MIEKTVQTETPIIEPINPAPISPTAETPKSFMSQKTLTLIGILSFVTIVLLILAFYVNVPQNKPIKKVYVPQTVLSIPKPVASASAYMTDITLTTERKKVTTVEIELTYDPKVLTKVDIKPGPFFPSPTILYKKIDTVKGRISYLLGIGLGQKPIIGNGVAAILTFTPTVKSGITTISFLPTSKATVSTEVSSILTAAHGIKFFLGPTPTP
jgi:hypothetical protein